MSTFTTDPFDVADDAQLNRKQVDVDVGRRRPAQLSIMLKNRSFSVTMWL